MTGPDLDLDDLGEPDRLGNLFDKRDRADGLAVLSPCIDRDRLLFDMRERRHRLADARAERAEVER